MFSSASGPFQQSHRQLTTQTPFQRLKPVCVELLSLTGRTTSPTQSQQVLSCLRRLNTTLRVLPTEYTESSRHHDEPIASASKFIPTHAEPVLTPSLINYVFYPLSELIRAAPKGITSLPESICEAVLEVLELLCSQWWRAWSEVEGAEGSRQWQVWCDLVILSSSVLGAPSSKDAEVVGLRRGGSDEMKIAALRVLTELLSARFRAQQVACGAAQPGSKAKEGEWEWDGTSELPDLDDHDATAGMALPTSTISADQKQEMTLIYPTPAHLSYGSTERVAKGAISFVLSSCFDIAQSSQETLEARSAALHVVHSVLMLWIGGTCPVPSTRKTEDSVEAPALHYIAIIQGPSSSSGPNPPSARMQAAHRLLPLLPGITSTLTRLATSRIKPKHGGEKQRPTPSPVAAKAVELLADLFRATLSDESMHDARAHQGPLVRTTPEVSSKVTDLEDFSGLDGDSQWTSEPPSISPNEKVDADTVTSEDATEAGTSTDAKWALSTLAQVHLALKTLSPLTQPSLPGTSLPSAVHPSVQKATLRLALILLSDCGSSFAWLDQQLEGMARLDAKDGETAAESDGSSSVKLLLSWIVDLASEYSSASVAQSARAAFEALQKQTGQQMQASSSMTLAHIANGSMLWSLLIQALTSLPPVITAHNDSGTSRLVLRISTALDLLIRQFARQDTIAVSGGPAKLARDMQDAFMRLLRPLKIDKLEYVDEAPQPEAATWRLQPVFAGLEASTSTQISRMLFNVGRSLALSLVHKIKVNQNNAGAKIDLGETLSLITLLVDRAARLRSVHVNSSPTANEDAQRRDESLTSLAIAADVLRGVSSCLDNLELGLQFADMGPGAARAGKQARKVAHKLGRRIFNLVMDLLDGDAEEAIRSKSASSRSQESAQHLDDVDNESGRDVGPAQGASSDRTLVERVRGISLASDDIESSTPERHGPALDLGFVRAANLSKSSRAPTSRAETQLAVQHRYQQAQRKIDLSNALLFVLLGSTAKLLGQSFRPLLLRGSYPLISGMSASASASSELVRQASGSAMRDIAFHTAYADVKNCLLDQADYILGSACQRLISGLDEELRAITFGGRAAGQSLTTQSNGAVLRKGNDGPLVVLPLVSAQQAPFVLVEMIRVLGSEIIPTLEDAIDEILDALDRFHEHPTICDGLLAVLDSILETMAIEQASKPAVPRMVDQSAAVAHESKRDEAEVFQTWLSSRKREQPAFDSADETAADSKNDREDKEDKPTKSQQVASQILSKAVVFLTHPSPILRSRVLGLLRHGIETLAPQQRTAELLPIVNTAWPYVMTRLGPSYSNVKASRSTQLSPIIDLDPSSVGAKARTRDDAWYDKMEASFVERDPQVWVAAARFVEAAAEHAPEFVGKRVVEEAWPRFEQLLTLMRWKFDPRMMRRGAAQLSLIGAAGRVTGDVTTESKALLASETRETSEGPIKALINHSSTAPSRSALTTSQRHTAALHSHIDPPFILASASSLPAQLTLCILGTLTTVVRHIGARMPDDAAWEITSHPFLLDLLDSRQPPTILRAAEELFTQLGRRNPEATGWALQAAFPTAASAASVLRSATPCFMHHAFAKVHAETVHHIVSSFAVS